MPEQEPPDWDLSDLYRGMDDPALTSDLTALQERAAAFERRCRGTIASPDCRPDWLRAALEEYDAICRQRSRSLTFADLVFCGDTSDPARGAFLQRLNLQDTSVARHLIFFTLELGQVPEESFRGLVAHPVLAGYRYFLERRRVAARHNLSEPEEMIVEELSNTGVRSTLRLYSEVTSRLRYTVEVQGETRDLGQAEVFALMYDPDRDLRRRAAAAVTVGLRAQSHLLTFLYNNLLQHKATVDRLRHYDFPEQERHEDNHLEAAVVDTVIGTCVQNYGLPARYYRLKRRMLGLKQLSHYDRYASSSQERIAIGFGEARDIVLGAFGDFSPRFHALAESFFTNSWIDARVRPGKRGGAFCGYVEPNMHPYVFMNYTGQARDVMTLAHELGHALHGALAGEKQHYFHYTPSLPLAETASVFGEMLVFERLRDRIQDPRQRLALLASKIEDTLATVFRQATIFRFEQEAHRRRRRDGELEAEVYNELWQSTMQQMFGDALELGPDHALWWMQIPHVYGMPFYVYAYAFGELLVLALYARYKQEGESFVPRYVELLSAGGSQSPEELLAKLDINVRSAAFWEGGIALIGQMLDQAEALANQVGYFKTGRHDE